MKARPRGCCRASTRCLPPPATWAASTAWAKSPAPRVGMRPRCTIPARPRVGAASVGAPRCPRSEEHTSELQSLRHLVCRLLLEKKKKYLNKGATCEPTRRSARALPPERALPLNPCAVSCSLCVISRDSVVVLVCFFFFNDTATTEIYTLSLHDALPISSFMGLIMVIGIVAKNGILLLDA